MPQLVASAKVRADHLGRRALIYVRQSTLMQVRTNTGSTARQYDLVQRARALGWAGDQIAVIDQDQGRSGASVSGRDGFQALVAEVGLGHAGAVLSLEVSRLARSCSDWYRLIEICALADTLVIDEEGVYDPGQYNDRLLLGFKGTMSEAELHWLRLRLLGGKLEKARQGALRLRVPVGLVHDAGGRVVLDPDEQVQQAVRLAFAVFEQGAPPWASWPTSIGTTWRFPGAWLGWAGRRGTALGAAEPRASPGHPAQSGLYRCLRLRAYQDPAGAPRRSAPRQGLHPGRAP